MDKKLTKRQQETLDYINKIQREKGYIPTVREICEALNLKSSSSGFSHLQSLEEKGYIKRDPTKPRALEVFSQTENKIKQVPVVGTVAAGLPILAQQHIEDYFPVPADMIHGDKEVFMLRVKGDSMINVGIYNNDYIMVEQKDTAENNEIVVALVDESATVKRFYKEDGHYRLQPENDSMDPIIVPEVEILGKVIGLFRLMQ